MGALLAFNMFIYCFNNPVNMSDPSGNWLTWLDYITGVVEEAVNTVIDAIESAVNSVKDVVNDVTSYVSNIVSKKEPPRESVGYEAPKGKRKVQPVKAPNGQKGFPDIHGNVWVPIPEGHQLAHDGEHWDVNYPNGGYDNVYPPGGRVRKGGGGRGMFSPEGKGAVTGVALIYGAYRVARMVLSLYPPLWWTIPGNLATP